MPKASLDGLKKQIAAGEYAVDSRKVAGAMLAELTLIQRVRPLLTADEGSRAVGQTPPKRRSRAHLPRLGRIRREQVQ